MASLKPVEATPSWATRWSAPRQQWRGLIETSYLDKFSLRAEKRLHVSNGVASLKPAFPDCYRPLIGAAPRQQWRGLIETCCASCLFICSCVAPRQQWRGLIETRRWSQPSLVPSLGAPRQQWRGLIETPARQPGRPPACAGSTSAMAWPH